MALRKYLVALLATGALLMFGGVAGAAFPNYSDCPRSAPGVTFCLDIQAVRGNLRIKEFNVPLGDSLEIRGGLIERPEGGGGTLVPPAGTNGFFARPVPVPGGLLGIDWIPGNEVLAITELAGTAPIVLDTARLVIALPVKVRLVNFLLGMNCHIGTDANPVRLNLIVGTTSPPPPNRPITGSRGTITIGELGDLRIIEAVNVENSFSIPDASSCGLGLGLINLLVDARLGLPSAGGNNEIQVTNNIGLLPLG